MLHMGLYFLQSVLFAEGNTSPQSFCNCYYCLVPVDIDPERLIVTSCFDNEPCNTIFNVLDVSAIFS